LFQNTFTQIKDFSVMGFELSEAELLGNLFDSEVAGILVTDAEFRAVRANKGFLRLLGYRHDELLTKSIADITHPDDRDISEMAHRNLREGDDRVAYEKRYVTKRGEAVACKVGIQCGRRDANGRPAWYLGFVTPLDDILAERMRADQFLVKLEQTYREAAGALARAIEARDSYTAGHQDNVAGIALRIGTRLGLEQDQLYGLYLSSMMHDIGKIGIPQEFLSKVTRLTPLEHDFIRQHATMGYDILKEIKSPFNLADAAHQHHERMDGTGYPRGLKGDAIILDARIIAVADTVDSMLQPRPYRRALGADVVRQTLMQDRGTRLDAAVVDACLVLDHFGAAGSKPAPG
ncbi:MAG: HD domain-containing phosphohydrolase, partial [Rhodospirillaceae bacterium]|nr:HD domain-containing phosphohydrolase [Rhodospirillaceae bacterium]